VTTGAATRANLGRKQRADSQDFWETWRTLPEWYERSRIENLVDKAVEELRPAKGKRVAYAWSGGKDSQALRLVAERAGITECVLAISELEYPEFLAWATDNMPEGLTIVNTGQDLGWLMKNRDMLFPKDAGIASRWFHAINHAGQRTYYKAKKLDALLLGRRHADGNYTGPGGTTAYKDREGTLRVSPIAEWSHEDVLAALRYFDLELAPCYGWPRGFRVGTGSWPARQWCRDEAHGWQEVFAIDPDIVRAAAPYFPGAARQVEG